ncbi:MAG: hypothetical protein NTV89_16995 [Proteobacteria bacterium]|nr:hypothetical protein [Pseudomonadota bacterium]
MNKGESRRIIFCLSALLLAAAFAGSALAQDYSVTGKTYALYLLTYPNNNFYDLDDAGLTHLHVTFKTDGGVEAMGMDGHGFYFAAPFFFGATYYIVGFRMGFETLDAFTAMTGVSLDTFVAGVGFFLINYNKLYPYVFSGFVIE